MPTKPVISSQAETVIQDFIKRLSESDDLSQKTLGEYESDLRDFASWFEATWNNHHEVFPEFHPTEITTPTIIQYREHLHKVRSLKPATVNRRLNTIKRYFEWAALNEIVPNNYSKPVKLIPEEKTSPRRMSDKEEAALITAAEKKGNLRDRTILLLMLHTGLRSMEVCNLTVPDVVIGKRSGQLIVRGKRNKQREVPLNSTARDALETYIPVLKHDCKALFPLRKDRAAHDRKSPAPPHSKIRSLGWFR